MRSSQPVARRSSPTAARSVVGTSCTQSSGRPAAFSARRSSSTMAREEWKLSEPPRSTTDIARLDAKRAGVGGDVGAGLVDHADDADRHPHAADHQAVGARPLLDQGAHRVGQGSRYRRARGPSPRPALRSAAGGPAARRSCRQPWRRRYPWRWRPGSRPSRCGSGGRLRPARGSWRRSRHCAGRRRLPGRAGPAPPRRRRHLRLAWSERSSAAPV